MKRYVTRGPITRLAALLLSLMILLPMPAIQASAAGAGGNGNESDHINPALAKMLDSDPNGNVRVIVVGNSPRGELSDEVNRQGGKAKKQLGVIKAVSTEMPAGKVREMAKNPNVQWITADSPMVPTEYVDTNHLATIYDKAVGADHVWNGEKRYTGRGVTVAVIDSGIAPSIKDFSGTYGGRVIESVKVTSSGVIQDASDTYGHGTHVAGIIAGRSGDGRYIGVAPEANLVNIKVSDGRGMAYMSDVINGIQWAILNQKTYNIRVINLSLVSSVAESHLTSPLDAAVEMAWLSGITVVVSAGNLGPDAMLYAPANDPLAITVGAVDTNGTVSTSDDVVPFWSSYGKTQDGFSKPEVGAPGRQIVSTLASPGCELAKQFPDRITDSRYIRLSGTSMAAPVVSGIAALILQAHPNWTPDQVKSAIMKTAHRLMSSGAGSGEVDAYAAISLSSPSYANQGVALSAGVANEAGTATYPSATWNSATWNSATWNSATWNSATWNSATWNSATWNSATWNSATWNSLAND